MKLLVGSFLQPSVPFPFLGTVIFLSPRFSNTLSLSSCLSVGGQFSHPHKTVGKISRLYYTFGNRKKSVRGPCKMNWLAAYG